MLKARIITSLVAAAVISSAIFMLSLEGYALLFGVVAVVAGYEWGSLLILSHRSRGVIGAIIMAVIMFSSWAAREWFPFYLIMVFGILSWFLAAAIVWFYPQRKGFIQQPLISSILGILIIWSAWVTLLMVRIELPDVGVYWVFWILLLVASADIGAFFTGRRFGARSLAPLVSPGKTWEGVFGGLLVACAVCGGILSFLGYSPTWWLYVATLSVISVVGDLFESVLKRERGVKDSGNLLPGHGGILDRIDGVLSVLPFFGSLILLGKF